ncbi:MAG: hypothetical protein IT581_06955 [Verrucomicrobiales bacterium]|nr:hypothetical protein [Verrucomicrobiales bacterium]
MKTKDLVQLARTLLVGVVALAALDASSATLDYSAIDGGGGRSGSAQYNQVGSIVGFGSVVMIGSDSTIRSGFLGQLNDPPRARTDTLFRPYRLGGKARVSQVLANDDDPEGGPLRLVSVRHPGAADAAAAVDQGWVLYDPPRVPALVDQIQYLIEDLEGDRAVGWISVKEQPRDTGSTRNILGIVALASGEVRVDFIGIPGRTYRVEWAANLEVPDWVLLGRSEANAQGLFAMVDAVSGSARFYRAVVD